MTDRATCWSITINNPKMEEYQVVLPPGWKLEGQLEMGEQGTEHYQGMLRTPQTRFAAVKKHFPRAHIEVARNKEALKKYVHKEDTRLSTVESIPTLFEYQTIIAEKWVEDDFIKIAESFPSKLPDEVAMFYLDSLVARDIESGRRGAEFIAINPMWRSSWKHFWRSIINRNARSSAQACDAASPSDGQACSPGDAAGE